VTHRRGRACIFSLVFHYRVSVGMYICVKWQLFIVLGVFKKWRKATNRLVISVRLSVGQHGTTRLLLDGFLLNFIFEYFSKIFREHPSLIKIGQDLRVIYAKSSIQFLSSLAQFFLEWEMLQAKVAEKMKTHSFCSVKFLRKSWRLWKMFKNIIERGRPLMTMWHMRIAYWIPKATNTNTQNV